MFAAFMGALMRSKLADKRASERTDLFSPLCHARGEDGERFGDDEVVNHMIFLMMAAHDTTTSTLTTMFHCPARHPEWQERLREDAFALPSAQLCHADLAGCERTEWVMKESLRMYPPLTSIPRKAARRAAPPRLCLPAVRRRRAPVHRPALRRHGGQERDASGAAAFPLQRARGLPLALPTGADRQAARRLADRTAPDPIAGSISTGADAAWRCQIRPGHLRASGPLASASPGAAYTRPCKSNLSLSPACC